MFSVATRQMRYINRVWKRPISKLPLKTRKSIWKKKPARDNWIFWDACVNWCLTLGCVALGPYLDTLPVWDYSTCPSYLTVEAGEMGAKNTCGACLVRTLYPKVGFHSSTGPTVLLKPRDYEEGSRRKLFLRASARKTDAHTLSVFQICHRSAHAAGQTRTRARTYIMKKPSGHFHIHIYMYMRRRISHKCRAIKIHAETVNGHLWRAGRGRGRKRERERDRERASSTFISGTFSKLKSDTLHHSNLYANVQTSICDGQNSINWDDRK